MRDVSNAQEAAEASCAVALLFCAALAFFAILLAAVGVW